LESKKRPKKLNNMDLKDYGYNDVLEKYRIENHLNNFEIGRVVAEHKERYIVMTPDGEFESEITGNMRFMAKSREDYPAVGDWLALTTYDSDFAIIHQILPRYSSLKRKAVGQFGEVQLIATNIDFAFLIQAVDRDFSINRLERYLTICNSSKVSPVIILSKIDLIEELKLDELLESIKARILDIPIISISNETRMGFDTVKSFIEKGKTYCMLGSSGVGKSTLMNNLSGHQMMRTGTVSQSTDKGRHVTSHRELVLLDNGGILIDNPGMREVGIVDDAGGLEITFDRIGQLSKDCKFMDCTHTNEIGCSVIDAVEKGELDRSTYENFLKMEKEKAYFDSTVLERRRNDKAFGKMLKNFKKDIKGNLY
jgi:ribosome biogenesis GTPase / thiamine phosphate phosphatase